MVSKLSKQPPYGVERKIKMYGTYDFVKACQTGDSEFPHEFSNEWHIRNADRMQGRTIYLTNQKIEKYALGSQWKLNTTSLHSPFSNDYRHEKYVNAICTVIEHNFDDGGSLVIKVQFSDGYTFDASSRHLADISSPDGLFTPRVEYEAEQKAIAKAQREYISRVAKAEMQILNSDEIADAGYHASNEILNVETGTFSDEG